MRLLVAALLLPLASARPAAAYCRGGPDPQTLLLPQLLLLLLLLLPLLLLLLLLPLASARPAAPVGEGLIHTQCCNFRVLLPQNRSSCPDDAKPRPDIRSC